jgi:hypothetical protein
MSSMKTTTRARPPRVEGADLYAAILGRYRDDMVVRRQAHRVSETDSDELILVEAQQEWWVARRLSEHVVVWAYPDHDRADAGFDELLTETGGRGAWIESRRVKSSLEFRRIDSLNELDDGID